MDRFRVTLTDRQAEERTVLRHAFAKGVVVEFRGRPVTVRGEFVHLPNGAPAKYVYEIAPAGGAAAEAVLVVLGATFTVTVSEHDREEWELLRGAYANSSAIEFRGWRVQVLREVRERLADEWVWTFEVETM